MSAWEVETVELSGIAIFYFVCLGLGFLFALVSAIAGEIGGHIGALGGHEAGIGHGVEAGHEVGGGHETEVGSHALDVGHAESQGPSASIVNTITVSVFVAFFGLSGLFATYILKLGALPSLAFAIPVAMLVAVAQFVVYVKIFVQAQASSEATAAELIGCLADVITPLPEKGVGEIAYVIKGTRYTAPAISADGAALGRGAKVQVVNIRGNSLVVRLV